MLIFTHGYLAEPGRDTVWKDGAHLSETYPSVRSLEEIYISAILKGIDEINEMPVVQRWKAFHKLLKRI